MGFSPWTIVAEIGLTVGLHELQKWLADPPPDDRRNVFSTYPATAEGTPIPIVYGRTRIRQSCVAWFGVDRQRKLEEIEGLGNGDDGLGAQLYYGMSMLFVVGLPMGPTRTNTGARLLGIYGGEQKYEVNLAHGETVQLFGALGINGAPPPVVTPYHGTVQFFAGTSDQLISNNAANNPVIAPDAQSDITEVARFMRWAGLIGSGLDPAYIPGYRNQMLVALTGDHGVNIVGGDSGFPETLDAFFFGPAPTVPTFSFEVLTVFNFYNATSLDNGDACPMSVIRDIFTNPWSRGGLAASKVDDVSFGVCATTLFAESHGYSNVIDTRRSERDVLQEIANQIGAAVYYDPADDKIHAKLIRDDYTVSAIPYFGPKHVKAIDPNVIKAYGVGTINRVTVRYSDRGLNYADTTAMARNMASAVVGDVATDTGLIRTAPLEYPGVSNIALARSLAERDLKLLACPLSKIRVTFNRLLDNLGTSNAAQLRPGMVFKLDFPDEYINGAVFRVVNVDPGQLGDQSVIVDATLDIFRAGAVGATPPPFHPYVFRPLPILKRLLTEAPRWLQLYLANSGVLPDADVQRLLALAKPDGLADRFMTMSQSNPINGFVGDVPMFSFPFGGTVATAYDVEKEPYDTTTGLVITNFFPNDTVAAQILPTVTPFSAGQIGSFGYSLVQVGAEILAFESATDIGGSPKQWQLNNVWRALLDTAPKAHAVGERVYFLGTYFAGHNYVGRRGWSALPTAVGKMIPRFGFATGSGEDATDTITIQGRAILPPRVANLAVKGKNVLGTQGIPAIAGQLKSVSLLEEAVDVIATRRDRTSAGVIRGDAIDETQNEVGITYKVQVQKVGATAADVVTLSNVAIDGTGSAQGLLVGGAGHGAIDLVVTTRRTVAAGEGSPKPPPGTTIVSWDSPRVRMTAPRWRNLLANSRFDYGALTPGWVAGTGLQAIGNDATSIPLDTTGFYFKAAPSSSSPCTIVQTVDVAGYLARKMFCILVWYQRSTNSDTNDTVTAKIDPLDASSASLGSSTSAGFSSTTTEWTRNIHSIVNLPALTSKIAVTMALNEVATLGSTLPETLVTECELIVGQFLYDVLTNGSWATAAFVGWTAVTNSFVYATAIKSPSANYIQGGAFASCELRQDYTLLTGWEVGSSAVLRCWRAQTLASDTGRVVLECLDGGSAVLASADTTAENLSTLNQWVKRRLSVDIPVGTVTLRVRLLAVRTLGAGNSGACFDDCVLSVHKQLDPLYERVLSFAAPSVQPMPATYQQWWTQYSQLATFAGLSTPVVFAANVAGPSFYLGTSFAIKMRWSDDVTRAPAKLVGQFGNVGSTDGYRFTRQSGAGALDYQTFAEDVRFASPTSATSFTAIVFFRIDELGFATACGLTGRQDTNSGWGLEIDATGHVLARLIGTSGTKTATLATTVHDGAIHMAAIVYDAVAQTVTVYDERGGTSTSTAAGLGEISNVANGVPFRVGRGRNTIDTLPGLIGRIYVWEGAALSAAQVAAQWNYGKDPNGTALVPTRSVPAWCPGLPDANGETLAQLATDQLAVGYTTALTTDGGTGFGLAQVKATANLVTTFDFTVGASWTKDTTATITQGIVDATGKPNGITVTSPDTANGWYHKGITVGAPATVNVVFWARAATGTPTLRLELLNASFVSKDVKTVVLGLTWKRYVVNFTAWDASTGTCIVRWLANSGVPITFDLTHVVFVAQGTEIPALLPNALASIADVTASLAETPTVQLNAEGEVVAVGVATIASPATATIANVKNNSNNKNRRELLIGAAAVPRLDHYDSAGPTNVSSSGTAIDWSQLWTVRGRWCAIGTLDNAAAPFAGVVTTGSVNSAAYGRAATWTYDTTADATFDLAKGAQPAWNGYLRSLTVRAREVKLV